MNQFVCHISAFLGSAITAIVIMPWLLNLCHKLELTYISNDKHQFRIPRVGGMVLAPAVAVGLGVSVGLRVYWGDIADTLKISAIFIMIGVMLVYLLGIIDDIFQLDRWKKRLLLISASLAFPACNLFINDLYGFLGIGHLEDYVGRILTILLTILVIKGLEEMNDSDGLIGGLCIPPLFVFGLFFYNSGYYSYSAPSFAMLGALLVFLYYNLFGDKHIGTKTYMGHAGAMMLSFCVIYISLKYAMVNKIVITPHRDGLVLSYSMFIIPVFEYIRVWAESTWLGLSNEQRRQLHIQHKLKAKNFSEIQVLALILLADILFILLNLAFHHVIGLGLTWIVVIDIVLYSIWQIVTVHQKTHVPSTYRLPEDFIGYAGQKGLVSVIMPTYNSAEFVAESIDSILSQTYKNLELIISDDCSSDNTMEILEEYSKRDSRIIIQRNEKNGGAGVSRNNSIKKAKGQYIAFCDSDDRWVPKKLEKQIAFMKAQDIALCFAPYYTCDENNQYLGYISAPRRVNLFQMMCDNKMGFLTCIYDTNVLGKHYMPKQRKRQDHALLLNLLKVCKYAYSIPTPLAHYRIHPGNMSGKKISLIKYNAQTYTEVFHWPKPLSYIFLFTFFMPTYFYKKFKNMLITIIRAAG